LLKTVTVSIVVFQSVAISFQVVEDTMLILEEFGYKFEKRGLVKVKGKGELVTYFLVGKEEVQDMPNQATHL
jgi:hypothetical protein